MSDKATPKGAKAATGKWTDAEKLALFMSIIQASGPTVNWANVNLPAGRSKMACWHVYNAALKEASSVPLANGDATPTKKRAKKSTTSPTTTTAGKRKRAPAGKKGATTEGGISDGDEQEVVGKKIKKEEDVEEGEGEEEEEEEGEVEVKAEVEGI